MVILAHKKDKLIHNTYFVITAPIHNSVTMVVLAHKKKVIHNSYFVKIARNHNASSVTMVILAHKKDK